MIPALTHAYSGRAGCNVKIGEPQVPQKHLWISLPVPLTDL
jgi:hypothetical protein